MLKRITLLRERVADWTTYPFSVPAIATLPDIDLHARVTFFAGENGTGKSTLLEAVAAHIGFGREGGNRNFSFETTDSSRATEAGPVGLAKLGVDGAVYLGALAYCRAHP